MMRMRRVRQTTIVILIATLLCPATFAQAEYGSLCVAPISEEMPPTASGTLPICGSNKFSLKIDSEKAFAWPTKESVKIDVLDLSARHRVVVYCQGRPHQSFTFRFSEFKTKELCLFLNDLYKTAQLWDSKQSPAPWCKCK